MFIACHIQRAGKVLFAFLVLCLVQVYAYAGEVSIAQPYTDTLLCKGGSFNVSLSYYSGMPGYYDDTNNFYIELSDVSGNFSAPTIIGTGTGTYAPYLTCYIPTGISIGTAYRIRVRTTAPAEISSDNGKNIRISPYPQFTISGNSPLCAGSNLSLSTSLIGSISPVSYSWTGPSGFGSSSQNPSRNAVSVLDKGYYVLSATHYTCKAKDSILIQVISAPTKMNIRTNSPICTGEELSVLTDCDDCKLPGVTCNYSMKLPGGTVIGNNNLLVKNVTPAFAGKYVVSVSVLGCSIKDSMIAIVKSQPDSPSITINTPLCLGDTLKLLASSNQPGVSFVWTGPNGFTAAAGSINMPNIQYNGGGVYSVKANLNGCSSVEIKDSVIVGIPLLQPAISGRTTICQGDSMQLYASGNNQLGKFEWFLNNNHLSISNPLVRQNIIQSSAGYYKVIQKYNGCISPSDSILVSVPVIPKPEITINNPVCFGQPLNMHIEDVPDANYKWNGPAFTSSTQDATINSVSFTDSGKYVAIVSIKGCVDSTIAKVKVLSLPKLKDAGSNSPVCDGDSLRLWAMAENKNSGYVWTGPASFASDQQNPMVLVNMASHGDYIVQAVAGICKSLPHVISVDIKEKPSPVDIKAYDTVLSFGETLYLSAYCSTADVSYSWVGPDNYKSLRQNDTIYGMKPSVAGEYIAIATGTNGCSTKRSITVLVDAIDQSKYSVYPNPNNGNFTIYGELNDDAYFVYDIFDAMGRSLKQGDIMSSKKSIKLNIDMQGAVAPGVYYVSLKNVNHRKKNVTIPVSITR